MNAKELAQLLNGREYRQEITPDEEKQAKENNLVVVFGASDDLMEFRGAIHDEFDCYGGRTVYLTKDGILKNDCDDEDCPYFNIFKEQATQILSFWDEGGYLWQYRSVDLDGKFETFEIIEEDGGDNHSEIKYCKGIVFSMDSLK